MIKLFIFATLLSALSTCNQVSKKNPKDHVTGGPCTYSSAPFETAVLMVTPDKDSLYTVTIKPFDGYHDDRMTLNQITNAKINAAYIQKNDIKPGRVIKGKLSKITKGTCTPWAYELNEPELR